MKRGVQTLCKLIAHQFLSWRSLVFTGSRSFVIPQVESLMAQIESKFAVQQAGRLESSGFDSISLLINVPAAVVTPLAYTIDNVRPFDSAM